MSYDWETVTDDELEGHLEMAAGLAEQDAGTWQDFAEEVTTERERRAETSKAVEAQRRRREQAKYAASPEGRLSALKKDLAAAQAKLAESDRSPTSVRVHPDQARDHDPVNAARIQAAQTVAGLQAQVSEAERRLPLHKFSDDELLDLAAEGETILTPLREAGSKADAQMRESGIQDTSYAVQKARRDLAAAEAEFSPVIDEMAFRKRDARNAVLIRDREVRVAMRARDEALPRWKAEEQRLLGMLNDSSRSGFVDLGELRAAQRAVEMLEKAKANYTPVGKDELEAARSKIAEDTNIQVVGPTAVEIASW